MKIFGLEIRRSPKVEQKALQPATAWTTLIETYPGQWQQDVHVSRDNVLSFSPVFACVNAVAGDVAKLPIRLMEQRSGVWQAASRNLDVLRTPNGGQTRGQFFRNWIESKLLHGNAYVLKLRNRDGRVTGLRVMDPCRVEVLLSDNGSAFYRVKSQRWIGNADDVVLPASEVIHDKFCTFEHPLVGISPIAACALSAAQGVSIQRNSAKLFANMSRPAGILTAPGAISDDTASRLKAAWGANYGGDNYGKTAVLGDGLTYETVAVTAKDAELIAQLKWSAEDICRAFGVPAARVGVVPQASGLTYTNVAAMAEGYYAETLQAHLESIEALLDDGLGLDTNRERTEFDLDELLRTDAETEQRVLTGYVAAGILTVNEARARLGLAALNLE